MSGEKDPLKTPPAFLQPGPLQRPHRCGRLGRRHRREPRAISIRPNSATLVQPRCGSCLWESWRWWCQLPLVRQISHQAWYQDFTYQYPGTSSDYVTPVDSGFPWWLRWQHFFNLFFMVFIIRAGLQILADHPRLYLNSGSKPDTEWLRLRGPVPEDRRDSADATTVWTAKDDSVALPAQVRNPRVSPFDRARALVALQL